jgi:hypothetical protein
MTVNLRTIDDCIEALCRGSSHALLLASCSSSSVSKRKFTQERGGRALDIPGASSWPEGIAVAT